MAVAALTGTIIGLTGRGEVIARRRLVKYWRSDLAPPIFLGLALHRWRFTAKYGVRITPNRRASAIQILEIEIQSRVACNRRCS